ncbi:SDR family oxidoreductase [Leifsonia xyli]|uniref:SDR family oxidoreductase n=1 Tax=Leifsonia xyli TaxID=1575 RepID=UPI001F3D5A61|nr:SDR family NAD(P)-dependent oxidoreductase [Leifsonia xyli]
MGLISKRVVVTGASSGIGAATVRLFRERGWEVVGVARRSDRLAALAAETGAETFAADLTRQEDVDALRDRLAATGGVHALVNNAGGARGLDSVESSSVEDWIWMFDINMIGTKRVVSALLPLLREGARETGHASILNVTSIAGHTAYRHRVVPRLPRQQAHPPLRREQLPDPRAGDELARRRPRARRPRGGSLPGDGDNAGHRDRQRPALPGGGTRVDRLPPASHA